MDLEFHSRFDGSPFQEIREKGCGTVYDATDATESELTFLASLAMAKPLPEATFATMDLDSVMGWLSSSTADLKEVQPEDPTNPDRRVLLIVASPEGLCDNTNFYADQRVMMAVIYMPPYIKTTSFQMAFNNLEHWRAEVGRITHPTCLFLRVFAGRGAAPFSDPYPLWFDCDEDARRQIHNSVFDVGCFRVFHLHRAEVSLPEYPGQAKECICTPQGPGHAGHFRLSTPERPLPRAKNVATCLRFSTPSDDHWALAMDQVFDSALALLAQNRLNKESAAAMAALEENVDPPSRSGKGRPLLRSSKGKHLPPEPLPNLGGAASTSGLTPKVPDETLQKTKKVLNNLKDLKLHMVFDIGGMKVVDQQLTDFLIVDFLCLRTMLGEDLIHNVKSYHTKILKAATVLEEDLAGYLHDSVSPAIEQRVRSSMRRFKNNCTAYCLLPEAEFDCTRLEVDEFLMSRLRETVSQKGSKTLMEKLAERVSFSQG